MKTAVIPKKLLSWQRNTANTANNRGQGPTAKARKSRIDSAPHKRNVFERQHKHQKTSKTTPVDINAPHGRLVGPLSQCQMVFR